LVSPETSITLTSAENSLGSVDRRRACHYLPMRLRFLALAALLAALAVPAQARPAAPVFHGSISVIDAQLRERMTGSSWHRGCPVRIRDLRLLKLDYWRFDGTVRRGRLIVHEDQAFRVKRVFSKLFDAHFRIKRMRLIDAYDGSDDRSMDANNTSAFNCRFVAGTTSWSQHAYGRAIDINPIRTSREATSHPMPVGPTRTVRGMRWG
jgi:hypothetical protein